MDAVNKLIVWASRIGDSEVSLTSASTGAWMAYSEYSQGFGLADFLIMALFIPDTDTATAAPESTSTGAITLYQDSNDIYGGAAWNIVSPH